ncbi:MAG: hypothetical protein KF830_17380 [Planctomycetes bacterium]|nr:hypothetical protein [Planctomycetota bacterium]
MGADAATWRRRRIAVAAALAGLLGAMLWGAAELAFLCDDAFITFRYVSNAIDGHGLCWNPPPFRPVEGFTSLLWTLQLWAAWSWFGVEPPAGANVLSIATGVPLFALLAWTALRLRRRDGGRVATGAALLTLAAIVGNRTFLQWLSGGLGTSLFVLAFVGWALVAFEPHERRPARWVALWSAFAALAALARPEGLLCAAATTAVAVHELALRRRRPIAVLPSLSPMFAVLAQFVWHRAVYGTWLTNTYHAKVAAPWPEAGLRYARCFVLEHGLWAWPIVVVAWLTCLHRRGGLRPATLVGSQAAPAAAVAVLLFHAGYYTFVTGGDHFEYRVLAHLVPLCLLAALAMAARCSDRGAVPAATVALLWLASTPGWWHLARTSPVTSIDHRPLAPHAPALLRPLVRLHDADQAWLQLHLIGLRCNQHAFRLQEIGAGLPPRTRFAPDPDDVPVVTAKSVGLLGWRLPDCALLDLHGLNDFVVARTPPAPPAPPDRIRLRAALAAADADADGRLGAGELAAALEQVVPGAASTALGATFAQRILTLAAAAPPDGVPRSVVEDLTLRLLQPRMMAHERSPPPGYVEDFAPNVVVADGQFTVRRRSEPLTPARVRALEQRWWQRARDGALR